jgi:Leucine-rich repeat (LRR) protein
MAASTQQRGYIEAKIAVAQQKRLKVLYLRGSMIPHHFQLRALSSDILGMTELEELYLSNHKIDTLPSSVDQFELTNLTVLTLESNRIRNIPAAVLGSMVKLRILLLGHNHLEELPPSVSNLVELQTLSLMDNALEDLPSALSGCSLLRSLDVTRNKITLLPKTLGQLPCLKNLVWDHNGLSKVQDIGGLTALETLSIDGSPIKAGLPPSLSNLTSLKVLKASFCFTRAMAKRKGSKLPAFDPLEALANNISSNAAAAAAPKHKSGGGGSAATAASSGGPAAAVAASSSSKGDTTGTIDTGIAPILPSVALLQVLELRSNNLAELPESVGKFLNLESLNLSQNNLVELPVTLGHLVELTEVRVDRNSLQSLPGTIGSLVKLTTLCAHSNMLPSVPPSFKLLSVLTHLDQMAQSDGKLDQVVLAQVQTFKV